MRDAISIDVRDATHAFLGVAEPDTCARNPDPFFAFCMFTRVYYHGALRDYPGWTVLADSNEPPYIGAGRLEIYIVSDGEISVTLRFEGLDGVARMRATRPITGWMERLPTRCPTPGCQGGTSDLSSVAGYGGVAHDVGQRGFVSSFATSLRSLEQEPPTPIVSAPAPGTQAATACIYPWYDSAQASPDPADHPTGCDVHPLGGDQGFDSGLLGLASSTYPLGTGGGRRQFHYAARGPVYVGYQGAVVSSNPGALHAGYGVWIRQGIR